MLEYRTFTNRYPNSERHPVEQLNKAAREGWRLVTAVALNTQPSIMFIMEREKVD